MLAGRHIVGLGVTSQSLIVVVIKMPRPKRHVLSIDNRLSAVEDDVRTHNGSLSLGAFCRSPCPLRRGWLAPLPWSTFLFVQFIYSQWDLTCVSPVAHGLSQNGVNLGVATPLFPCDVTLPSSPAPNRGQLAS